MSKLFASIAALSALAITPALAQNAAEVSYPPEAPYQKVSDLVALPDFLPGMGELFVSPDTLPAGPFLAFDHDGRLVSTTYMIPIASMKPDMSFDNLAAPGGNVDHTDIQYNPGHPGVEEPHIHIVLWHVSPEDEASVAK